MLFDICDHLVGFGPSKDIIKNQGRYLKTTSLELIVVVTLLKKLKH